MVRNITTLQAMGKEVAWMLVQQARGIPDAKGLDDYLTDRTFIVLFARPDLSERLCITAAIRQMSGHVVYMGPEEHWQEASARYPKALLGSLSYYMDGVMVHGVQTSQWGITEGALNFPVMNLGSIDAHPAHALADIMCMLKYCNNDLRKARLAWIGHPSGTLISLLMASKFFPFSIRMALPEANSRIVMEKLIADLKTDITICETAEDAVKGCQFISGGSSEGMSFDTLQHWHIGKELMAKAADGAYVLAGTNPMHSIPVDEEVVTAQRALFLLQSQNRLRIYKRMLHWLYEL